MKMSTTRNLTLSSAAGVFLFRSDLKFKTFTGGSLYLFVLSVGCFHVCVWGGGGGDWSCIL